MTPSIMTPSMPADAPGGPLRRALAPGPRAAVAAVFLLNGGLFGAWASRVPAFADRFDLGPDTLGLLLLGMAAGAIAAFPVAGRLSDRIGAARLARGVAALYVLTFWALGAAPSVWALAVALLLFGAAQGALDVAMNAWGAEVERAAGRPLLSSLHAMFSLGAGLGAASGYAALRLDLGTAAHFLLAGGVLALALCVPPGPLRRVPPQHADTPPAARPWGGLALVGLVAASATLTEGAAADWSALFLHEAARLPEAQAALGYVAFSVAMVAVRLAGDGAVRRWGPVRLARASGLVAALGVVVVLTGQGIAAALAGFALMGVGCAIIAPLAFSRAAAQPGADLGRAVAGVATFGYGGLLLGPPLIGLVAHATSLHAGMALLGALMLAVAALAPCLARPLGARKGLPGN